MVQEAQQARILVILTVKVVTFLGRAKTTSKPKRVKGGRASNLYGESSDHLTFGAISGLLLHPGECERVKAWSVP
jgi:hypothetical protein